MSFSTRQARASFGAARAGGAPNGRRPGLPGPEQGTARLYGDEASGLLMRRPGRADPPRTRDLTA